VEVELWNVLVSAAIGDQAIAGFLQIESLNEHFDGLEKIVEKVCIRGCEVSKILAIAFGDQQDVQRIAGPGMLESQ
jgi:hypothetical protein